MRLYLHDSIMQERLLLDSELLQVTIHRLCHQLIENHEDFRDTVIIGLQPRGVFLARRLHQVIEKQLKQEVPIGFIDTTFHRDDFRRRDQPLKASKTEIPFLLEEKNVILVDDVLYTGRTVRAALDAMINYGRPKNVELVVLIDRLYSRHVPIQASYVGKKVNTLETHHVNVNLKEQGGIDQIVLVNNNK